MQSLFLKALFVLSVASIYGCNLANSSDPNTFGNSDDTPMAKLTIVNGNANNQYSENDQVELSITSRGSRNSRVASCITTLYRFGTTDTFGTEVLNSIDSCSSTSMVMPSTGRYKLELVVTDDDAKMAKDQHVLLVTGDNLNAEFDAEVMPNSLQLSLDASDSTKGIGGDIVSYAWQVKLKLDDSIAYIDPLTQVNSSPTTDVVLNTDGVYVIQLTITDAAGNTDVQQMQLLVDTTDSFLLDFSMQMVDETGTVQTANPPVIPGDLEITVDTTNLQNLNHVLCMHYMQTTAAVAGAADVSTGAIYQEKVPTELTYGEVLNSTTVGCSLPVYDGGTYVVEVKAVQDDGSEYSRKRTIFIASNNSTP